MLVHNGNRKHQINIHQRSEDKSIIRWLSELNQRSNNSIVCPQKESHTDTGGLESERDRQERFLSRETLRQNQAWSLWTLAEWCAWKTFSALVSRKRSIQCWEVRGRDAWMRCRHFHCNCLNSCSLLSWEQTLGGWQSQFCSSHRSSTQDCSLDTIQGTLGDQEKN